MLGLDKQSRLNRQLRHAAAKGSAAEINRLLDAGAEIESRGSFKWGGGALHIAALTGNKAAVQALLDRGADIKAKDNIGDTPLSNARIRDRNEVIGLLLAHAAATGPVGQPAPAAAPEKPAAQNPAPGAENHPDEVVIFRKRGNRLLEESFNFAARERITLLRNGMDGPVEAMTRDSFSAIDDKEQLRYAFGLYKQQGGRLDEADVFPDALGKKPLPGRTP